MASEFAATLRAGKPFARAAERYKADGVLVAPADTVSAASAGEAKPVLLSLTAPGQVSGPVHWTRGGYSVVQLVRLIPERAMTFEEAKQYVTQDAATMVQERLLKQVLQNLRERYKVTEKESLLDKMPDPRTSASPGEPST
jgi:hypothetical protein